MELKLKWTNQKLTVLRHTLNSESFQKHEAQPETVSKVISTTIPPLSKYSLLMPVVRSYLAPHVRPVPN